MGNVWRTVGAMTSDFPLIPWFRRVSVLKIHEDAGATSESRCNLIGTVINELYHPPLSGDVACPIAPKRARSTRFLPEYRRDFFFDGILPLVLPISTEVTSPTARGREVPPAITTLFRHDTRSGLGTQARTFAACWFERNRVMSHLQYTATDRRTTTFR